VATRYETVADHYLAMVEGLRVIAVINLGRLLRARLAAVPLVRRRDADSDHRLAWAVSAFPEKAARRAVRTALLPCRGVEPRLQLCVLRPLC
jgi:hypothetical protein